MTSRTGDLDADADSLTCNDDHPKLVWLLSVARIETNSTDNQSVT